MLHRALRTLRQFHRMSQVDLAAKLDISNSYLSEIEAGIKKPGLDLLERYAVTFKIPVSSILLFSEQMASGSAGERLKFKATDKVLRVLEWIAESEPARYEK